ncbi:MAG: hypothetical protein KGL35_16290 [Bradyrhizobium sp.]|nr:hypothetical protein [Bradyrhizobium sp.]
MEKTDLFSTERAGFAERLARLTGGTTWREVGHGGHNGDPMPDAHSLAASLAFARRGSHDIGPDILSAIVCQAEYLRPRIVTELTAALVAECGRVAKRNANTLPAIASHAYLAVVYGHNLKPPAQGIRAHDYLLLTRMGEATLWAAAEQSLRLAERAYYSRAA